jgi:hypothetical protein
MTATTTSSEIDDIFSQKPTTTKTLQHSRSNLKQKKRKHKRSQTDPKRPTPEIVLDPSIKLSHSHASTPTSKTVSHDRSVRPMPPSKKRKLVGTKQDQEKFKDSRGTAPRKRFP